MIFNETDGCGAESRYEHAFHDCIQSYGWPHTSHPEVPGTGKRADFLIDREVWIEVFGLAEAHNPEYDLGMKEKRKIAIDRGLKLVELLPEHFDHKKVGLTHKVVEIQEKLTANKPRLSEL